MLPCSARGLVPILFRPTHTSLYQGDRQTYNTSLYIRRECYRETLQSDLVGAEIADTWSGASRNSAAASPPKLVHRVRLVYY